MTTSDHRIIIEMGMGNNLHAMNYQKAAERAIQDAFRHSTLPLFPALDLDYTEMRVQVTVGVQDPSQVDAAALAAILPRGRATVTVVMGGQNVPNPETGDTAVIATAAVEAFLPNQSQRWTLND